MREDQKRRQPHHTTQHDTIRHTGTTIEIGTGRDEMRHDREWRCMAMAMGGKRGESEAHRQTDRQTDTQTEMWRERREGMAMHGDGDGRKERRESEAHRQTDTQTDRGVAGEEGGREGDLLPIAWERIRRGDSHTTRYDTTHRNNDRDRHRTRRDETWQGMAMHGDGDGRERERGREWGTQTHRQTDRQTDRHRGVAGEEGGRKGDLQSIAWERIRRGDSHTTQHTIRYDTQEQR
jgi:hypothetical protein